MNVDAPTNLFDAAGNLDPRWSWFNAPPRWGREAARDSLWIEPAAATDFWQRTHYGFRADNGHALLAPVPPPRVGWTLAAHVRFAPLHQYDQAGLIVRVDEQCWLKTSVEFEPPGHGVAPRLGAVVTNAGYSDWSTQDFPRDRHDVHLRVRRAAGRSDYTVECSADGAAWTQIRLAHLNEEAAGGAGGAGVTAGLYACSPKSAGFRAEFSAVTFTVEADGNA